MLYASTHVRYDHSARPRDLHVVCPTCRGRALATKPSERDAGLIVGDCRHEWTLADWNVMCESCSFRASELAYVDLPAPYYEVMARGVSLWAFNRDHLAMLLDLLEGRDIERHPYAWFASYARREWMARRARKHLAKAIRREWGEVVAAV